MAFIEKIDRLTESNYDFWAIQMKSLLVGADLWKFPSGRSVRSEAGKKEEWDDQDERAAAMIALNLSASQIMHVKQLRTSKEIWDKLKEVH